MDTLVISNG